jgi:cytochrome P450 family 12
VLVANRLLSNEDEHFQESATFIPERWLRDNASACAHAKNANPFVYMPFGFGARSCVGRRFAELEIEILVARFVIIIG